MGENIYVLYLIEIFWYHRTIQGGGNTKWEREWKDDRIYANPPSLALLSCAKIFSLLRNLSFIFTVWPYEGRILNLILKIACMEKLLGIARNKSSGSFPFAKSIKHGLVSWWYITNIIIIRRNFDNHTKWSKKLVSLISIYYFSIYISSFDF